MTRFDLDSAFDQAVAPHRRFTLALVGIAGMPQFGRNFFGLNLLAYLHRMGNGIDAGRIAEDRALETLVDHSAKLDVVVGEKYASGGRKDEKYHQGGLQYRIAGERPFSGLSRFPAGRDLEFYGHKFAMVGCASLIT